jgi:molybdopterin molybdotransferase
VGAAVGCAALPRRAAAGGGGARRPATSWSTVDGFAEVLSAGRRIVSSNSYALAAQLAEAGMEARPLGIAADTPRSLREHLERARGCDALVTSAGISVGEHDHVLARAGRAGCRGRLLAGAHPPRLGAGVRTRRGARRVPLVRAAGEPRLDDGGTFELFVRPSLLRMAGHTGVHLPTVPVTMRDDYGPTGSLTHFPRVRLEPDADGGRTARLTGSQGSGVATSMAAADALLVVPPGTHLRAGDAATAVVLGGRPFVEAAPF